MQWKEDVEKVLRHHEEMQKKHGIASNGRPKKGVPKGWSLRDTADDLGMPLGTLSEIIQVAKAVREGHLQDMSDSKIARLRLKEQRLEITLCKEKHK